MEEVYLALSVSLGAMSFIIAWLTLRGKATSLKEIYNVPVAVIKKIYVYPFKSCHRIELSSSECLSRGLKYDR